MDRPLVININWPDPLKHFAKDHPGWKLTVHVVSVVGKIVVSGLAWYLLRHA